MSTALAEDLGSVQPIISHNVWILMAHKRVGQEAIAAVIHKTATSVGHKLNGRAKWTPDEIVAISRFGGPKWPISRFFEDPESFGMNADGGQPMRAKIVPQIAAVGHRPDISAPARGHLRSVR